MWSPALAVSTSRVRAPMTASLVASASASTVVPRAVKPRGRRALATSLASFTQPLSQLVGGSDLNSLIPTHRALLAMAVPSFRRPTTRAGCTGAYTVSQQFEDGIRSGVDDVGEPRRVVGVPCRGPGQRARPGDGHALEQLLVEGLHEDTRGLLLHGPQARDERRGAGIEEGLGEAAHRGEELTGPPGLARVEDDERADTVRARPVEVLRHVGGAEVLLDHGGAASPATKQHLRVGDVVGARRTVAREVQQVESAAAQQTLPPGRGGGHGLGAETVLEVAGLGHPGIVAE